MKPVVCIAGPTASGKSAWAVQLAKKFDGEVINADSMQVYADLHVLTARPSVDAMEGIPHHLFGTVAGSERYSVGAWVRDAVPVIMDCLARDKLPILAGGTGLYFKALTEGLAEVPDPGPVAKAEAEALLSRGIEHLRAEAERLDPVATARIMGDDPQRLGRIVSVALGTAHPLSVWQSGTRPVIPKRYWLGGILNPERSVLYDRINNRFEDMVRNGGLAEAKKLRESGLDKNLPVMKAIGVPSLIDHLEGKKSLDQAIEEAKRDTRRLAKRQYTWFKGSSEAWFYAEDRSQTADFEEKLFQKLR